MTEAEARDWIAARYGADVLAQLDRYVALLLAENESQNLISKASVPEVWTRHILDSVQLASFAGEAGDWLDVGSGPGLPGIVLSIVTRRPVLMVEPRRKRVEFLRKTVDELGLAHAEVRQAEIEKLKGGQFAAVTARAYAQLSEIFRSTVQLTTPSTVWVLPKGRSAQRELEAAREAWQGVFHVEHSLTSDDALIVVATGVRPR